MNLHAQLSLGQYLSTNGLFGTVIDVAAIMFFVEFGLVMDIMTQINSFVRTKKSGNMSKM